MTPSQIPQPPLPGAELNEAAAEEGPAEEGPAEEADFALLPAGAEAIVRTDPRPRRSPWESRRTVLRRSADDPLRTEDTSGDRQAHAIRPAALCAARARRRIHQLRRTARIPRFHPVFRRRVKSDRAFPDVAPSFPQSAADPPGDPRLFARAADHRRSGPRRRDGGDLLAYLVLAADLQGRVEGSGTVLTTSLSSRPTFPPAKAWMQ